MVAEETDTMQGYKQTEVGLIPSDWEVKTLKDILKVIGGGAFSSRDAQTSGLRWLKIANVGINQILWEEQSFLPDAFENEFKSFLLKGGDVVLALTRPILGSDLKIAKLSNSDGPCLLNQRVGKVENKAENDLIYIYHLLQKGTVIEAMQQSMAGTDPPNLSNKGIYSIQTPFPPTLAEQRAIATALSDVDALITSLDALITKKRNIKQGAMQQLLTGKKRLPGFSGGWVNKKFGDVISGFSSGSTPSRSNSSYYKGPVKWITSGELNYNVIVDTIEKISDEAVKNTNLKLHPKGTFLMAITGLEAEGTRGSCAITGVEATTNQSCMALFPTNELLTEYLFHYYVCYGNELAFQYCQGTKQQSYTAKLVKILPISLPPTVAEQRAIVQILSEMDTEIEVMEQKRNKYMAVKQGMMQQLLTGKIRLVQPQA